MMIYIPYIIINLKKIIFNILTSYLDVNIKKKFNIPRKKINTLIIYYFNI